MKRLLLLGAGLLVLAVAGWFTWRNIQARKGFSIAASGGRAMALVLPELGRTYLQKDPLWRDEKLGSTSENLGSIDCAVCSVAMASTSLGFPVTPSELNGKLRDGQGFTPQGWLVWGALPGATDQHVEVIVADRPSHAAMDAALERGEFPVVKFILLSGITHWVVVVGKDGLDYLVRDPLKASEKPVKLSSRTSAIYSVRFVRRKAA
ncbi:MAG: hypothetical protein U0984_09495 [Prosthecobacter sp.]|nr:hypothetical protein [Prosthecobacter sp.]